MFKEFYALIIYFFLSASLNLTKMAYLALNQLRIINKIQG